MRSIGLLFEDNEDSPVSKLLRNSVYGDHIYFSGGCNNILFKIEELLCLYNTLYVFYDLVPNNINTIKKYKTVKYNVTERYGNSVYLFPILCIEYIVCKYLLNKGYLFASSEY